MFNTCTDAATTFGRALLADAANTNIDALVDNSSSAGTNRASTGDLIDNSSSSPCDDHSGTRWHSPAQSEVCPRRRVSSSFIPTYISSCRPQGSQLA